MIIRFTFAMLLATTAQVCAQTKLKNADCSGLTGEIGKVKIEAATLVAANALTINPQGPTPASRVVPANSAYCKVNGFIPPVDPNAPNINFQINLPLEWNERALQIGGGGFNGVLIPATGLPPAHPLGNSSPLTRGYLTFGTDSGHQNKPNEPVQAFALNDEALVNFAHASYKKVKDVAVMVAEKAYGKKPKTTFFMGSSEGGREGLTVAQRYPADYDGVFSRVPVINWTGLQHMGLKNGLAAMGEGWLAEPQVKLVNDAVIKTCDILDGATDQIISNPDKCKTAFKPSTLLCKQGQEASTCLNAKQVKAVETLHTPYRFAFALENGVRDYPGYGVSGENLAPNGPTGGWRAWWVGGKPPSLPPKMGEGGIAWYYGAGAIQYFYAQDPKADLTKYNPNNHKARIKYVSSLMDSTNPNLSAFHARGGKLIILENMADYAQSPYAGIQYYKSVVARMGKKTDEFLRLYTAPNVDHVGSGAPANVDFLEVLEKWVDKNQAPQKLTLLEQKVETGFPTSRSLPLCHYPETPRYNGLGNMSEAANFSCVK
jgi:Tannase and feruloyl esterase